MRHSHLRTIILSGTIVLACLVIIQVYWFKRAFDVAGKQFDHNVQMALKKVADSVAADPEIKKLSSNFFFVAVNSALDDKNIDDLIKKEFLLRNLDVDYELGIYNADDDTLVYGHYVEATIKKQLFDIGRYEHKGTVQKNFAIYFPKKESYLAAGLDIWIFSTLMLLLMMGFFAYAIASLLREKRFAELKNDFINNMTHEFKTPVTNIRIAGEILSKKMKDPEGANVYIDILLKENEKLSQKIDKILSGASTDHFKKPAFETVDVHQLIEECADAFQLKVQQRNGIIQLEFNAINASVRGDRELLAQAINNVIDNAEKYSPGYPKILVRTKDCNQGIEIEVIDEGMGISSALKSKVFEKFFRVQAGNIHNVKGFGLGLNFAKSVVRSHRGKINLFSDLNKGTEVRIFLPNT